MVKFTDKFFAFPIRIVDKRSKFQDDPLLAGEAEWVSGMLRVPADMLDYATWNDHYTSTRTIDEVREDGFDCTMVFIPEYGEVICNWPRKKFEEKLNEFIAKQPLPEKEEDLVV